MEPMNELRVGNDVQLRCMVKSCDPDETTFWYAQVCTTLLHQNSFQLFVENFSVYTAFLTVITEVVIQCVICFGRIFELPVTLSIS